MGTLFEFRDQLFIYSYLAECAIGDYLKCETGYLEWETSYLECETGYMKCETGYLKIRKAFFMKKKTVSEGSFTPKSGDEGESLDTSLISSYR